MSRTLIFFLTLLLVTAMGGCDLDRPHPTDDVLIANFESHESEFDQLIQMCREDSEVVRIAPNFTWTKNNYAWPRPESELGFSVERWNDYRSLFGKLGLASGIDNYQPDSIYLISNSRGMVTGGSSKGFAYLIKPPSDITPSLDAYKFEKEGAVYRHIQGNWYLYSEVSG